MPSWRNSRKRARAEAADESPAADLRAMKTGCTVARFFGFIRAFFRWPSATAVVSLLLAITGFSYNAWQLEKSEENSVIRSAAFQVLNELAALEQVIYAGHYDQDPAAGNPRRGWVKVGLVTDLAALIGPDAEAAAEQVKSVWADSWPRIPADRAAVDRLITEIDRARAAVKSRLEDID